MTSEYKPNLAHEEDYIQHNIDFWKKRARYYDHGGLRGTKVPQALRKIALEMAAVKPEETVLDVCTGTGQAAAWFSKAGAKVTGIDVSQDMLSIAAAKLPEITFRVMEATKLEFPDKSFDVVNIQAGLHDMPMPVIRKAVTEMVRVAKREVIIAEPYPPQNLFLKLIFRYLSFPEFFEAADWKGYTNLDLRKVIQEAGLTIEVEKGVMGRIWRLYRCKPVTYK